MKRWKALALTCIAALCCSAVLAGCSSQAYTPTPKNQTISNSALSSAGTLRVGVNASAAPLAGQTSSSSEIVGIDVDMAAALADQLGLKLEVVDVSTDAAGALTSGKVDVVMGVNKSDSPSFWTSDTYLPTAVALFAQSSNSTVPANSASTKIAAQVSSNSAWAVTNEFDNSTITTTEDLKSAFSALESGKVQYVAADAVVGSYVSNNAGMDVHMVALMQQASGYCVGVLDGNTQLKQAVSNALSAMNSNGVSSVIQKKWLGTAMDLSAGEWDFLWPVAPGKPPNPHRRGTGKSAAGKGQRDSSQYPSEVQSGAAGALLLPGRPGRRRPAGAADQPGRSLHPGCLLCAL